MLLLIFSVFFESIFSPPLRGCFLFTRFVHFACTYDAKKIASTDVL